MQSQSGARNRKKNRRWQPIAWRGGHWRGCRAIGGARKTWCSKEIRSFWVVGGGGSPPGAGQQWRRPWKGRVTSKERRKGGERADGRAGTVGEPTATATATDESAARQ